MAIWFKFNWLRRGAGALWRLQTRKFCTFVDYSARSVGECMGVAKATTLNASVGNNTRAKIYNHFITCTPNWTNAMTYWTTWLMRVYVSVIAVKSWDAWLNVWKLILKVNRYIVDIKGNFNCSHISQLRMTMTKDLKVWLQCIHGRGGQKRRLSRVYSILLCTVHFTMEMQYTANRFVILHPSLGYYKVIWTEYSCTFSMHVSMTSMGFLTRAPLK